MKLKDKVVLITDALSRTGYAIAKKLAAEGAILVLNEYAEAADTGEAPGNKMPGGEAPNGKMPDNPQRDGPAAGMVIHADPRSKAAIDAAVRSVLETYGHIDVVVHTNNEVVPGTLEEIGDDAYDRAIDINIKSAFLYVQAAGRSMKQAKKGNFVFVSSIHDEKPTGGAVGYSIAKGALKMLIKEMVLDLGPHMVRTNLVEAGPLEGDDRVFANDISPLYEHTRERIVNHQYCRPEDVAEAVLLFAGDDCQAANGSELRLDGGFLLTYFIRRKVKSAVEEEIK